MAKKQFTPSAALGYKRIKPLYDKAVSDLSEQAHIMEELEVERVLLQTKLDHRVKKCKLAGLRVAELLRLCKAQQVRNDTLMSKLNRASAQLHVATVSNQETNEVLRWRVVERTQRNQALALKNLELAELADKYRGELENIRIKGVYAIITVGVLALGYGLLVIGR